MPCVGWIFPQAWQKCPLAAWPHDQQAAPVSVCATLSNWQIARRGGADQAGRGTGPRYLLIASYAENDEPQPQDLEAFGFTKLNPCLIKVFS